MAEHDERQAPAAAPAWWKPGYHPGLVARRLHRALAGIDASRHERVVQGIICAMLRAGGLDAVGAFLAACEAAEGLDAQGRRRRHTLSRARTGDARAHEGAHVPPEEVAP